MKRLIAAIAFAAEKHRDQKRKDAEVSPYVNHSIALANVLAHEAGVDDERVLIAAILHDSVEDTETTAQELVKRFGQEVADVVLEVKDDKSLAKVGRKRLQVTHARSFSRRVKRVKLADKICNVRDIADCPPASWSIERRREYIS
jgi:GTP diphosphokinase / guanosine-3',5'-bis(diphosphate) 3'-diphosphatase